MSFNSSSASVLLQNHVGWQLAKKMRSLLGADRPKNTAPRRMDAIQAGSAKREDRGTALAKIPAEPLETSFWKYLKLVGGAEVILSFP